MQDLCHQQHQCHAVLLLVFLKYYSHVPNIMGLHEHLLDRRILEGLGARLAPLRHLSLFRGSLGCEAVP